MVMYGVALLALCTIVGAYLGDLLGVAIGVKANVGGVGIAMVLLVAMRWQLTKRGAMTPGLKLGVEFWSLMYIPIVVAMAAQQNVVAAVRGGPMVLVVGVGAVALSFACVPLLSRIGAGADADRDAEPASNG
jgi:malonate transporter MadL subunit